MRAIASPSDRRTVMRGWRILSSIFSSRFSFAVDVSCETVQRESRNASPRPNVGTRILAVVNAFPTRYRCERDPQDAVSWRVSRLRYLSDSDSRVGSIVRDRGLSRDSELSINRGASLLPRKLLGGHGTPGVHPATRCDPLTSTYPSLFFSFH